MKPTFALLLLCSIWLTADAQSRRHKLHATALFDRGSTTMRPESEQALRQLLERARRECVDAGARAEVDVAEWFHKVPKEARDGTARTLAVASSLAAHSPEKFVITQRAVAFKGEERQRHVVRVQLACRAKSNT